MCRNGLLCVQDGELIPRNVWEGRMLGGFSPVCLGLSVKRKWCAHLDRSWKHGFSCWTLCENTFYRPSSGCLCLRGKFPWEIVFSQRLLGEWNWGQGRWVMFRTPSSSSRRRMSHLRCTASSVHDLPSVCGTISCMERTDASNLACSVGRALVLSRQQLSSHTGRSDHRDSSRIALCCCCDVLLWSFQPLLFHSWGGYCKRQF